MAHRAARRSRLLPLLLAAVSFPAALAADPIRLVDEFALSPDGQLLAFSWAGDVWVAPSEGGAARPLTRHPADDREPRFSPDGTEIAFTSDREGSTQVYVMPAAGGAPERLTWHTEGYHLEEWHPDGTTLLVRARRDHDWRESDRFFLVDRHARAPERLLFDDHGTWGRFAPDGASLLFMREGTSWFRKGYHGSQAAQIWRHDVADGTFDELLKDERGFRYPCWRPDGQGFWYVGQQSGSFNLWELDLESGERRRLTDHQDDAVLFPAVSRDGGTLVYRHLFDLYRLEPGSGAPPHRIDLQHDGEPARDPWLRRTLDRATEADFSDDGLEVTFIAGGDIWVMDTELKEPRQITDTPEMEHDPIFTRSGDAVLFVSDREGRPDIWRAERADPGRWWWQNDEFVLRRLTDDEAQEEDLSLAPQNGEVAYVRGAGDLVVMDVNGGEPRVVLTGWNSPSYDWSPDGQWIVCARSDDDFNRDVWIIAVDGSRPPFNLSVHPDNDDDPVWSPDGRLIAFTGRRQDEEVDVHYVWVRAEDEQQDARDRLLKKALEKMDKERKEKKEKKDKENGNEEAKEERPEADGAATAAAAQDEPAGQESEEKKDENDERDQKKKDDVVEVTIDFDGLIDRIHTVSIADSYEGNLFWLEDNRLAFTASPPSGRGIYTIEFPEKLDPEKLTATGFSPARYLRKCKQVAGMAGTTPAVLNAKGQVTSYGFRVRQRHGTGERFRAAFADAWRTMRDGYYDERLGNRDWDRIRAKYQDAAAAAVDHRALESVVRLMLGELNGSHLGFYAHREEQSWSPAWTETTAHLGVRFDATHTGDGWRIRDVLKDGPAAEVASRLQPGEIVLAVDGVPVDPSLDPTRVLNGQESRDVQLTVRATDGGEREVVLRPITFSRARTLLYPMWIDENRRRVDAASNGMLGYLHIRGMNWSSFLKFEEELYKVGYGRDGLVIDVRGNGGGFTTDHLLTVLTQPDHAVTVPRGGGPGYPHDRRVYATWNKPIVVLCDQDSFSNAEIFAHAVKNLGRGQVIGVPTAGGVISTGSRAVLDLGTIRMPFRGWFLPDGEDMELNGAVPHHIVWRRPGEGTEGRDSQLTKAVEVLLQEVAEWKAEGRPHWRKASERS